MDISIESPVTSYRRLVHRGQRDMDNDTNNITNKDPLGDLKVEMRVVSAGLCQPLEVPEVSNGGYVVGVVKSAVQ